MRKPGIYYGLSAYEYDKIEAVRCSTLQLFAAGSTPAHARHAIDHPREETDATLLGTAFHLAVLEPDKLDDEVAVAPKCDRRTTQGKAEFAAWEAGNASKIRLKADQYEAVKAMADGARRNPLVRRLLAGKGKNEVSIVWIDEETALRCKARIDRVTEYEGRLCLVDLKSTRDASRYGFAKSIATHNYHWQAAWYSAAMDAQFGKAHRPFLFVPVEKDPPHLAAVYQLDGDTKALGEVEVRDALLTLAQCEQSGEWPGYPPEVAEVRLPGWRMRMEPTIDEELF